MHVTGTSEGGKGTLLKLERGKGTLLKLEREQARHRKRGKRHITETMALRHLVVSHRHCLARSVCVETAWRVCLTKKTLTRDSNHSSALTVRGR